MADLDFITRIDSTASLLSPLTITIGADTDANSSGTIDLQTRALTRLQITNAGNVSVANKIGINQPVPTSQIHINPTYAINVTAGEQVIRFEPPNGIADFTFRLESTVFGGQADTDDVVMWGWNIEQVSGEPRLHFAMEREFFGDFEVHIEGDPTAAAICRYWTWNIDRATGGASHTIRADIVNIDYPYSVELYPIASFSNTEIVFTSQVRVQADIFNHETSTNGGDVSQQISLRPHPSTAAQSWLVFGDPTAGGGITVYREIFTGNLHIRSGGSSLTDAANVQANAFSANAFRHKGGGTPVQLLGAQEAAVADATGAGDVVAQLNSLLAKLRSHGLIAT